MEWPETSCPQSIQAVLLAHPRPLSVRIFSVATGCVLMLGCEGETVGGPLPAVTDTLRAETTIWDNPDFSVSSAVMGQECEALLVGGEWGTLVRLGSLAEESAKDRAPGFPKGARLRWNPDGQITMWSHYSDLLAVIAEETLSAHVLTPSQHPWGRDWVGPVLALSGGRYAVAALGDDVPRPQPDAWLDAPLVQVVDSAGRLVAEYGEIVQHSGRYLSWMHSRYSLGRVADTLLILHHANGMMVAIDASPGAPVMTVVRRHRLAQYFEAPPPEEEVRTIPWIQIGGDKSRIRYLWGIATAAFGPDGTVYAIRNYAARRRTARGDEGDWTVTRNGLEIYDRSGKFVGRYAVPGGRVDWLVVGPRGRILIRAGARIMVVQDPTFQGQRCPAWPERITLRTKDDNPYARARK